MADGVKVSKFGNAQKNLVRFFKDIRSELKKVIWPSRTQLIKSTATVLLSCVVLGVLIWGFDAILLAITERLFIK